MQNKYFIPIYKTSIKHNPAYNGHNVHHVPMGDDITLKGTVVGEFDPNEPPTALKDYGIVVTHMTREIDAIDARTAEITMKAARLPVDLTEPDFMNQLRSFFSPQGIFIKEINVDRQIQTIRSMEPASPYLYEYMPIKVTCVHCNESFLHDELESEASVFDTGDYTSTKCPKCGHWDCCEIEYEKINLLDCEAIIKQYAQS